MREAGGNGTNASFFQTRQNSVRRQRGCHIDLDMRVGSTGQRIADTTTDTARLLAFEGQKFKQPLSLRSGKPWRAVQVWRL
jgi:hypothetical protein